MKFSHQFLAYNGNYTSCLAMPSTNFRENCLVSHNFLSLGFSEASTLSDYFLIGLGFLTNTLSSYDLNDIIYVSNYFQNCQKLSKLYEVPRHRSFNEAVSTRQNSQAWSSRKYKLKEKYVTIKYSFFSF